MLARRRAYLENLAYTVWTSDSGFTNASPVFSVILTVFGDNLQFIRSSVESVLNQTHPNTELVLVSNGTSERVTQWLRNRLSQVYRATVLHLSQGAYQPAMSDPLNPISNLWNAALFASRGEFVYFLSYDDFLSMDYVSRMVALFVNNEECVSASPAVTIVDDQDAILEERKAFITSDGVEDTYMSGLEICRSVMRGDGRILAPGGVLAHRSAAVLDAGGFDLANDLTQFFKIGVRGQIGFDSRAKIFWRRHGAQANQLQKERGLVYYRELLALEHNYRLGEIHQQVGGHIFAAEFHNFLRTYAKSIAQTSLRDSLRDYGVLPGYRAARNVVRECPPVTALEILLSRIHDLPVGLVKRHAPFLYNKLRAARIRLRANRAYL